MEREQVAQRRIVRCRCGHAHYCDAQPVARKKKVEATKPKLVPKPPPMCLCGMPKFMHPTATCREFWERGL